MAEPGKGFVPGQHKIEAYGGGGFRFAEMSHKGSILALPSGLHAIPVMHAAEIDEASLGLVFGEPKGAIELLLVGTGAVLTPLPGAVRARLRASGIMSEAMATGAAVHTYNLLLEEHRRVAAMLIAV